MATTEIAAQRPDAPRKVSTGWMWLGALPVIGFWVPFVAGYRARHRGWMLAGMGVIAFALFASIFSTVEESNRFGGMFLSLSWILNGAVSFALRHPYARRMALRDVYDDRIIKAELVDEERRELLSMAAVDPALAVRLGVGRPDLPNSRHGHLVDVNHASADAIADLPGVGYDLAVEIVSLRDELGCFSSIEDLGALMTLHPRVVDAMRTRAVALPD